MVDALQGQFRLLPECADQLGSSLHGFQTTTSEVADFSKMRRTQVGDLMLLQIRPDRLDRIELGSVRRQEGDGDAPVLFIEPLPERAALVGTDAIPHDQQWLANVPEQCGQKLNDLRGTDRAVEEAKIEAPPAQARDCRHLLPGEALLDDRRLSSQSPSTGDWTLLGQSRLVYEDDGPSLASGLFFSAGHCLRFHCTIACSSRCSALRSGFCGVKPRLRNSSHPPVLLYATPNSRLISARTRLIVHSSVAKPAASAPCNNIRRSPSHCVASKCLGRPNGLRLSLPTAPFALASCCAQSLTDWRVTPSRRATSDCDTLRLSSRAPSSRRASIAFISRLAIRFLRRDCSRRPNVRTYQTVVSHLQNSQ